MRILKKAKKNKNELGGAQIGVMDFFISNKKKGKNVKICSIRPFGVDNSNKYMKIGKYLSIGKDFRKINEHPLLHSSHSFSRRNEGKRKSFFSNIKMKSKQK